MTNPDCDWPGLRAEMTCIWKHLDTAGIILVALDTDGVIRSLNRKGHEVLEFPEGELVGKSWFESCVPAQERAKVLSAFRQLLSGDEQRAEHFENRVLTRSGREPLIAWHNTLLTDEVGRCVGTLSSGEDITERKRVEEGLRESEERLRTIIETSPDAIALVGLDGRILMANQRAALLAGFDSVQKLLAIGTGVFDLLAPEDRLRGRDNFHKVMERGALRDIEYWAIRRDGSRLPVEVSGAVLRDRAGNPTAMIAVIRDITNRRQAEAALRQAKEAAEAANRAKSELLANMSHEIRTPLTAILGYADVLLDDPPPADAREAAATVKRNGENLLTLLNDILDISKIEAGKLGPEYSRCRPHEIVDEVASLMRARADSKGLKLAVEYTGPIPETIQTDPVRLRQILTNLVGNAVKFTELGSVRVVARLLQSRERGPRLRFDVTDTGIGLAESQIRVLFQPFTQVDGSVQRRFHGTGLGLAISKRLAQMLGGDIAVSSTPGQGSTFSVTIPTGPLEGVAMIDRSPTTPAAPPPPAQDETRLACRLLLAEDGPDNQRLISLVLRKAGAEVTLAENGQVAVDQVLAAQREGRPFDVVLMDMQMPVMDGYQAATRLRQEGFRGPIIALTAHAMTEDRQKCLGAGCDDYLSKPIVLRELANMVAAHVGQVEKPMGRGARG